MLHRVHISAVAFTGVLLASVTCPVFAQLPAGATVVASHLNGPRGLAFGPDGTLFIAEAGTGGTTPAPAGCPTLGPPGPSHGGYTGRISRVLPDGQQNVLLNGLPSSIDSQGSVLGVSDVTFLNNQLYALVDGGGCTNGNPGSVNGIYRVDPATRGRQLVADLGAFAQSHPAAYPVVGFNPEGDPYSFVASGGQLFTAEANSGRIFATTPAGATSLALDVSLAEGHVVPTSIVAAPNNNLYVGTLSIFPIRTEQAQVLTLSKDSFFVDTTPGFNTPPAKAGDYHLVHERAGFTTIVSLKFGPDGLLYALELSDAPGYPTPGAGKVVRVDASGNIETVVSGLVVPTGMTFGPDNALYVSNLGAAPAGAGQVLRIPITF